MGLGPVSLGLRVTQVDSGWLACGAGCYGVQLKIRLEVAAEPAPPRRPAPHWQP